VNELRLEVIHLEGSAMYRLWGCNGILETLVVGKKGRLGHSEEVSGLSSS